MATHFHGPSHLLRSIHHICHSQRLPRCSRALIQTLAPPSTNWVVSAKSLNLLFFSSQTLPPEIQESACSPNTLGRASGIICSSEPLLTLLRMRKLAQESENFPSNPLYFRSCVTPVTSINVSGPHCPQSENGDKNHDPVYP